MPESARAKVSRDGPQSRSKGQGRKQVHLGAARVFCVVAERNFGQVHYIGVWPSGSLCIPLGPTGNSSTRTRSSKGNVPLTAARPTRAAFFLAPEPFLVRHTTGRAIPQCNPMPNNRIGGTGIVRTVRRAENEWRVAIQRNSKESTQSRCPNDGSADRGLPVASGRAEGGCPWHVSFVLTGSCVPSLMRGGFVRRR
jgi:hypothetical protein